MIEQNQIEKSGQVALLSQGKPAAAENQLEGFEAEKAIDGCEDTYWAAEHYFQWWRVDLLQTCRITQIRINTHSGSEAYSHYFIEYSEDNLNWETGVEKNNDRPSRSEGDLYEVAFTARYVKVTVTYCSFGKSAVIRDFQVYGYEAGAQAMAGLSKASPHKFPADSCDYTYGFDPADVNDIEADRTDRVLVGGDVGSYLVYRGVDFTDAGVDQIRGQFGFTDPDREKRVILEVRVDALDGERIGQIVLFKQWKRWSILAGSLEHTNLPLLTGVHDVYLVIADAAPPQKLMIHWLAFVKKSPLPAPRPRSNALPAPAGGEYRIFFGNLHSHTAFSDGLGVPEEAYDYARYTAGLDFLAITEHSNLYDEYLDWDKSRKWVDIQKMADKKTENGAFLALCGAETTWYNQFGHMNTFNMEFFINTYETQYNEIPRYYDTLKLYPDSIHQWNHPWSSGDRHLDGFNPYDAELDEVLHMIEINPIECNTLGGLHYYVMALDKGWHVAPAGNQDNHHGQWGTGNSLRTAILVEELTREHFFDAVRNQRVYFTSALYLKVWFKVNGAIMGSRISRSAVLDLEIKALFGKDTGNRIVRAEIIGEQGRVIHAIDQEGNVLDYRISLPCADRYYFAKIYQEDGEFAATAPVWIEA